MSRADRIFIFGDSHAQPLVNALEAWTFVDEEGNDAIRADRVDCGLIALSLYLEIENGFDMLNPIFQRSLEQAGLFNRWTHQFSPEKGSIGLLFGYVDVHFIGLQKAFFDGFDSDLLSEGSRTASGAVQYAMLRELVRWRLRIVEKTIAVLDLEKFSLFLLSGPPPSSDDAVREHHPTVDAPPSGARRAVWHATQEVMAELAHRYGATLLTDQSRFTDADGFLLPQYVADGIHANAEHGRDYLTDIVAGLGLPLTRRARAGEPAAGQEQSEPVEPPVAREIPAEPAPKRGFARSVVQAFTRLR